jgi:hypothetical protein
MTRIVVVLVTAALSAGLFGSTLSAQAADARAQMERCVDRVLARMARAKAPEAEVGRAVISECDGPLRAALASAIRAGEAFVCSVESCIGIARDRAAHEARIAYRERLPRRASTLSN